MYNVRNKPCSNVLPRYLKTRIFCLKHWQVIFQSFSRNILKKTLILRACCVCREPQQPRFVIQCFVWGDRFGPIRERLRDLLCRSAQDTKEREPVCDCARGYHRAKTPRGYCRSKFGRWHAPLQDIQYRHQHTKWCFYIFTIITTESGWYWNISNENIASLIGK